MRLFKIMRVLTSLYGILFIYVIAILQLITMQLQYVCSYCKDCSCISLCLHSHRMYCSIESHVYKTHPTVRIMQAAEQNHCY